jgi:hypothetical protein
MRNSLERDVTVPICTCRCIFSSASRPRSFVVTYNLPRNRGGKKASTTVATVKASFGKT